MKGLSARLIAAEAAGAVVGVGSLTTAATVVAVATVDVAAGEPLEHPAVTIINARRMPRTIGRSYHFELKQTALKVEGLTSELMSLVYSYTH